MFHIHPFSIQFSGGRSQWSEWSTGGGGINWWSAVEDITHGITWVTPKCNPSSLGHKLVLLPLAASWFPSWFQKCYISQNNKGIVAEALAALQSAQRAGALNVDKHHVDFSYFSDTLQPEALKQPTAPLSRFKSSILSGPSIILVSNTWIWHNVRLLSLKLSLLLTWRFPLLRDQKNV